MTIAHLSDTHLGFRAFGRTTPSGLNQREADVMGTFRSVLDAIAERQPDVVVHSGDLFHVVRPSNATILGTFRSLAKFQARRKGAPFVLIGGNHDTPRMADSGNILSLFAEIPGVEVVSSKAGFLHLEKLDLEVLCVPSSSLTSGEQIDWSPTGKCKHAMLTVHGMARQALPMAGQFDIESTQHDRWSYVALGDYHVHQKYGRNVCYSGSTDFTSSSIWEETTQPKGWVWFDTEVGALEFVKSETRPVLDLPELDAKDLTPEAIVDAIFANANWADESAPIVRQRVRNVHSDVRGKIGANVIRDLNARCLNYQLRLTAEPVVAAGRAGSRGEGKTLEHSWDEHIAAASLPAGIDRVKLRDLGFDLLREVSERAADPAQA